MAITIVYDMLKAGISDKTKLALVEDFEKVLDLGLMESGKALLMEKHQWTVILRHLSIKR